MKKFLISSPMRVGSTLIGRISCRLFYQKDSLLFLDNECIKDDKLDTEYIKNIIHDENVPMYLKSHKITPIKMLEIFNTGIDLPIINIKRNLKDAWISRFFYTRYHRTITDIGLPNDLLDEITDMNHLSDSEFMKFLCRHSLGKTWAKEHLEFEKDDIVKTNINYLSIQYEDFLNDPHSLCFKLSNFLKTDCSYTDIDSIIEQNKFSKLSYNEEVNRERYGNYKFHRSGKINTWNEYLDEEDYKELLNF